MTVTIIYDNTAFRHELTPDWGFSCLVEAYGKTILFDTGANCFILLENMKKLDIDPLSIDEVFISHAHFDHIGGLASFLMKNNYVNIYVPASFTEFHYSRQIIYVDQPLKIHEHIYSTGELEGIEQSMVVGTDKGMVIITGCSHPGIEEILSAASVFGKPYAILGGFHGFNEYELFKDLKMICPMHCTQHTAEIKSRFPDKYIEGGAGRIIEL
ncbi:MAG: MBL fold metallo-hydrolase [Bacteroidales bacterium]|nr:MBL fold metallo-hydrolase [Bacteroidales bacterium]